MAGSFPARFQVILGTESQVTDRPWFVGDFRQLTVSYTSGSTVSLLLGIQGSNADGFQSAIPANSWSTVSTILTTGIFTIDPGFRWIRPQVVAGVSAASAYTVTFSGMRI